MEISITEQAQTVLLSLAFGVIIGIVYDCFRIFRLIIPAGKIIIFFQDIIFFSFFGVISFLYLLRENSGQARLFILVAIILGWGLYYTTVGSLIYKLTARSVAAIKKVLAKVFRWLFAPIKQMFVLLSRFFSEKMQKTEKYLKNKVKTYCNLRKDNVKLMNNTEKTEKRVTIKEVAR